MPLDLKKLERVVDLADGVKRARCPACAASGQDKKGDHLRVYPDGRFGCCVHPGDREHRQRIFALAGERSRQGIKVRVAATKFASQGQPRTLGRLGRSFSSPAKVSTIQDAQDGVGEVENQLTEVRTLRTPLKRSNDETEAQTLFPMEETTELRTLRTPVENPYVCTKKIPIVHIKGFCPPVLSVLSGEGKEEPPLELGEGVLSVLERKEALISPNELPKGVPEQETGEKLPGCINTPEIAPHAQTADNELPFLASDGRLP